MDMPFIGSKILGEMFTNFHYLYLIRTFQLVCNLLKKPMLMKRKEAKNYGTKKLIEGSYEVGKKALVIEDVVTTGSSIIETIEASLCFNLLKLVRFQALKNEGLICEQVLCALDREQGGDHKLEKHGVQLHRYFFRGIKFIFSLMTMTDILDYLIKIQEITPEKKIEMLHQLSDTLGINGTSVVYWSLENRKLLLAKNPLNKRMIDIMMKKHTNLCIAADLTVAGEIFAVKIFLFGFYHRGKGFATRYLSYFL